MTPTQTAAAALEDASEAYGAATRYADAAREAYYNARADTDADDTNAAARDAYYNARADTDAADALEDAAYEVYCAADKAYDDALEAAAYADALDADAYAAGASK